MNVRIFLFVKGHMFVSGGGQNLKFTSHNFFFSALWLVIERCRHYTELTDVYMGFFQTV